MKLVYTILIGSFIFFVRCDDNLTSSDIDNIIIPDSNISFSQYIAPVLEVKCVSCHDGGSNSNQPNLSNFSFVDGYYVVPGEPGNSILVYSIEGTSPNFPLMPPPGYSPLTQNQIDGIKKWIIEGAQNN